MISKKDHTPKKKSAEEPINGLGEIVFPHVSCVHNSSDPIIIRARILRRQVNRVYMDSGSSCEVIYEHCFLKIKPFIRSLRVDSKVLLVGFSGEHSWPIGEVPLEITIGDSPFTRTKTLNFVIARSNSLHNLLFGRTAMQKMGIVVSMIHDAIKFHTLRGIGTILSIYEHDKVGEGQKKLRETSSEVTKGVLSCTDAEERIIINDKYPEHMVIIGKQLPTNSKEKLRDLLRSNVDVFAWTHADMTGKSRTIMVGGKPFNTEHKLNEYKHIKPIKQKKRGLGSDRSQAACKEVEELIKTRILQRVKNQTLVANPVMVKKSDEDYHQIQMAEEDKDKTSFFAGEGTFCYRKMPFGLKNAGATYQRLVDKVFIDQIGRNIKAYVDDMVIKSISQENMLKDIQETFDRFRSINMKLNPKKCSFGVEESPFWGHLITKQGITANPSKIKAVTDLEPPRTLKDIYSLNGKLAALSRFH
ncbi:reverse transcriptase domain-containing protein [Tanacetum coccineum]